METTFDPSFWQQVLIAMADQHIFPLIALGVIGIVFMIRWGIPWSLRHSLTNGSGNLIRSMIKSENYEQEIRMIKNNENVISDAIHKHEEVEQKKLELTIAVLTSGASMQAQHLEDRLNSLTGQHDKLDDKLDQTCEMIKERVQTLEERQAALVEELIHRKMEI